MNRYGVAGNETVWPFDVGDEDDHPTIQWKMRYQPDSLTRSDLLVAASILAAYSDLTGGMFPRSKLAAARQARLSRQETEG